LAAAGAIVVLVGLLWFVRPLVQTVRSTPNPDVAAMQQREHQPVDARRTYDETNVSRLAWYSGPVGVAAGFAGIALLVGGLAGQRRHRSVGGLFLIVFGTMSALYLWRQSITPDQIWAMRRFLPVTLPGLAVGAAVAVDWLWRDGRPRARLAARAGAVVLAVGVVASPLAALLPVRAESTDVGLLGVVNVVCDRLPADAAVVITSESALSLDFAQTVRAFCDVPAFASADQITKAELDRYQATAARAGRRLYLISGSGLATVDGFDTMAEELVAKLDLAQLEQTLSHRPKRMVSQTFLFYVTPV
jgi:hypothetical protein